MLGERRRASPRDDLVSHLVTATVEGEQLTDDEFSNFFRLLVFAGNETTRTAMSHLAIQLASFPDQFDLLRSRRDLIPNAVEEIVRYCSPLYHFRRTATRDTILAGTPIREGEKVVIWYAAANFDERAFPDPEKFDVTRPLSARNVSYGGGGVHTCLGAGLARLELTQLLNEILDRQLRVELIGPPRFVRSNFSPEGIARQCLEGGRRRLPGAGARRLVNLRTLRGHRRILIDSSVWIYHLEAHAEFGARASRVLEALEEGALEGIVSELTLLELTVRPLQLGRQDVADEYELLLSQFPNVTLVPVSRDILLDAAALRARHRLRMPDAILLATAAGHGATAALTNDAAWVAAAPAGVEVILLSQLR